MGEPTIRVNQKPCPTCAGEGQPQQQSVTGGSAQRTRMTEVGGTCPACGGKGEIVVDVPLSELQSLLDDPGSFASRFAKPSPP